MLGSQQLGQADEPPGTYTAVSAGYRHNCSVRTDGSARCWGYNDGGPSDVPDDGGT